MKLVCIVWGAKHLGYLPRAVTSLLWPRNREALYDATVELHSTAADMDAAATILERFERPIERVPVETPEARFEHQWALLRAMRNNVGNKMFLLQPDTIWADGSLPAIRAVGAPLRVAVGVPHARVKVETFPDLTIPCVPGAMVYFAMQHLHPSFAEAILDPENPEKPTNSYLSGVLIRPHTNGTWFVQHRLPTPYYVHIEQSDVDWMEQERRGGAWDHRWPEKLYLDGRWRVIGSSEAAFAVELTPEGENHPPKDVFEPNQPDNYRGSLGHHVANRCMVSVWRA